jgi:hypothetical protein
MASELRVPTVAMAAEVTCVDGRVFRGRVFVPASSSRHEGPMRAEEWMNGAGLFFPFLPDEGEAPIIFNKAEVVTVTVAGDPERAAAEPIDVDRGVQVECGEHVLRGHLHIDMPPNHSRVLDYLNRGDGFLVLYDGDRLHLVQKQNITRVIEMREA